ncbi:Uncharacterized protein TCM_014440 [Theobroma cacao]|uniref:Uncharacterized protein n=1 Tax=Theobroma cacao TaxID=3641 RepID=A0A061FXI2_THECC|nr:Uncharacterized protein TCM_014440 [Theobroma cacao]
MTRSDQIWHAPLGKRNLAALSWGVPISCSSGNAQGVCLTLFLRSAISAPLGSADLALLKECQKNTATSHPR